MLIDAQRIRFAREIVHAGSIGENLVRTFPREHLLLKRAAFLVKQCAGTYDHAHGYTLEGVPLSRVVRDLLFLPKIGFTDHDAEAAKGVTGRLVNEGYLRLVDGQFDTVDGAAHEDTVRDLASLADTVHWAAQNHQTLNAPWVNYDQLFELIARNAPRGRSLETAHALQSMVQGEAIDASLRSAVTSIFVQISSLRTAS